MEAIKTNPIMFKMSDKALKKILEKGNDLLDSCVYDRAFTGNAREGWCFFFWKKRETKTKS